MRPRHSDRARRAAEDALDAAIDELRWWKSKITTRTVLSDDVVDAVASVASALQVDIAALSRALNAAYLDRRPRGEEDVEAARREGTRDRPEGAAAGDAAATTTEKETPAGDGDDGDGDGDDDEEEPWAFAHGGTALDASFARSRGGGGGGASPIHRVDPRRIARGRRLGAKTPTDPGPDRGRERRVRTRRKRDPNPMHSPVSRWRDAVVERVAALEARGATRRFDDPDPAAAAAADADDADDDAADAAFAARAAHASHVDALQSLYEERLNTAVMFFAGRKVASRALEASMAARDAAAAYEAASRASGGGGGGGGGGARANRARERGAGGARRGMDQVKITDAAFVYPGERVHCVGDGGEVAERV